MKTISKSALFIQSYAIFQMHFLFMIKLGFIFFLIQVFIPSIFAGLLGSTSTTMLTFQVIYFMLVLTPINLGAIVQILKMLRGNNNPSIKDIFNYFDKLWMSIIGYLIFILCVGVFGTIVLMVCSMLTGFDLNSIESDTMISFDDLPIGMLIGFIIIIIPSTYLYIKSILFFEYYIMDKNMGPINALKNSFVKSNGLEGEIFLIVFCLLPIYIILNLCGFGVVFLMPFLYILFTMIYINYLEKEEINEEKTHKTTT